MSLIVDRITPTIKRTVKVRFQNEDGSVYEGSIKATFKRKDDSEVQQMVDEQWANKEVCEEVLLEVDGITDKDNSPWPPEQQLEWVLKTRETVNALALDFLLLYDQTGSAKTSRKRR